MDLFIKEAPKKEEYGVISLEWFFLISSFFQLDLVSVLGFSYKRVCDCVFFGAKNSLIVGEIRFLKALLDMSTKWL